MPKSVIDPQALVEMFEQASAQQGAQLKKAVTDATLAALQGRELTLKNIKAALKSVADAASTGLAKNSGAGADAEAMLDNVVAGMDAALLKAVDANRVALNQLAGQGVDMREKHVKKALDDLDKMEDAFFGALKKAAETTGAPLAQAWGPVLEKMQAGGTGVGARAASTAEEFTAQLQQTMKSTRAASVRAAQALAEGYTAMVSGVLLGMAEALQSQGKRKG